MSAVDLLTVADALDRWADTLRTDRPIDASIPGLRQMARVVRDAVEPASREEMIEAAALARHSAACDGGHSLVGAAAAEAAVDAIIALGRRAPVSAGKVKALVERLRSYEDAWGDLPSIPPHSATAPGYTTGRVLLDVLEAASILSALQPGDGWQGIESAPKGQRVILGGPRCVMFEDWADYCKYNAPGFTHWMPLPAPPASLPQGEEAR